MTDDKMNEKTPSSEGGKSTPSSGGGKSTSLGLGENVEALLAYLFSIIGGLVFYFLEKKSKFVKFHAMQSMLLFVAIIVVGIAIAITDVILGLIPGVGTVLVGIMVLISLLIYLGFFLIELFMMYKSYKMEMYKLPYIGNMAEKYVK